MPGPNPAGAVLFGVAAPSSGSAWAVGTDTAGTLIEHWNGTGWTQVPSPGPARNPELAGVAALSSGPAWAVGDYIKGGKSVTLAERWNGTAWTIVPAR